MKKVIVSGFTLEIENDQCFISKGKFHASLNACAVEGVIADDYHEEVLSVPDHVINYAEKFEAKHLDGL